MSVVKPRVFVVNEPLTRDGESGELRRLFDLRPAREYGELVFLLPPGDSPPQDPAAITEILWGKLADFCDADYLLLVGQLHLIGLAVAVAACANDGRVNTLHWDRRTQRGYTVTRAVVWDSETEDGDRGRLVPQHGSGP